MRAARRSGGGFAPKKESKRHTSTNPLNLGVPRRCWPVHLGSVFVFAGLVCPLLCRFIFSRCQLCVWCGSTPPSFSLCAHKHSFSRLPPLYPPPYNPTVLLSLTPSPTHP